MKAGEYGCCKARSMELGMLARVMDWVSVRVMAAIKREYGLGILSERVSDCVKVER